MLPESWSIGLGKKAHAITADLYTVLQNSEVQGFSRALRRKKKYFCLFKKRFLK